MSTFFLKIECWTHEEGKGWRRVHVGTERAPTPPQSGSASALEKTGSADDHGSAKLSLIDLTSEPEEDAEEGTSDLTETKINEDKVIQSFFNDLIDLTLTRISKVYR